MAQPRSLIVLLAAAAVLAPLQSRAQQVQLRCDGTLLEARGSAEQKRRIERLRLSLALQAEAPTADQALALLQQRLASVRTALQRLSVQELEVSSPSTWDRPAGRRQPAATIANLRVTGLLPPAALQPLIREVGSLPGVRLAPVDGRPDAATDPDVRRVLLRAAYQDALAQAREIAATIGLGRPTPLEVQIESGFRPVPMALKAMEVDAAPPFDPKELPQPTDRLTVLVKFCAR